MAFPNEEAAAQALVQEHVEGLPEQKVLFAAYYSPDGDDPYILEVLEGFGYDEVGEYGDLMDTQFKPFGEFARTTDRPVHLVLTNLNEFDHAVRSGWRGIDLIRQAKSSDSVRVLYEDAAADFKDSEAWTGL